MCIVCVCVHVWISTWIPSDGAMPFLQVNKPLHNLSIISLHFKQVTPFDLLHKAGTIL